MPNMMVALPNIGGALYSTPQSVWLMPTTTCHAVTPPRRETSWNVVGCPKVKYVQYSQKLTAQWKTQCATCRMKCINLPIVFTRIRSPRAKSTSTRIRSHFR